MIILIYPAIPFSHSFLIVKVIVVALLALVAAQKDKEPVAIVSSNSEMNADGSYTHS